VELIEQAVFEVGLGNNGYTFVKYLPARLLGPAREAARQGLIVEHWGKLFSLRGWANWNKPQAIAERQVLMGMGSNSTRSDQHDLPPGCDVPDYEAMILSRDAALFD